MDNLNESSQLIKRQNELEKAMKRLGGARVTEERELQAVKRKLTALSETALSADDESRARRCSLADFAFLCLDPRPLAQAAKEP